jgi:DNA-binding LacI/PurR family transcriptional regulator
MDIFIDRNSSVPPFKQLKEQLKDLVDNGEYKENQGIPSIRELSALAGVSVATVQKTFSELKQEKLIYSKAGAGYFVARQVALSNNLYVFLPSNRLTFYTFILDGMFEANRGKDLSIQIYSLDTDKLAWNETTIELLKKARREKCGVIFIEEAFGETRRECLNTAKKVPFVTIEWVLENSINIVNDYRRSGHAMVEYMVTKRNAKSILVLKGREKQYNARERILGMQDAAREFNLVEGKTIIYLDTDFDAISAYETIKKSYPSLQKSDAVICANDYEAMGAIGAFLEKKILVGKDVALIGYGNMIDTVTSYIPLTTMDQRLKSIGYKAIEAIYDLRKGIAAKGMVVTVPTKLIERKT